MAAHAHGGALRDIDLTALGGSAIDVERQVGEGGDLDAGRAELTDQRVVQRYRQVGEVDVAIGAAADRDLGFVDGPLADDLATVGAAGNLAKDEAHRHLTSRRRR